MGAKIPEAVRETDLSRLLADAGLKRIHQGKVRDTYGLPDHPELLLVVATDRLSIFDFVLPCLVPEKGRILTALTVFWLTKVLKGEPNHLTLYEGPTIDGSLPKSLWQSYELLKRLRKRALVVKKLSMLPVECVVREYLTGSAWKMYQESQSHLVYGYQLPEGLQDGSRLPEPLFTPTSKEESAHDQPLTKEGVKADYGASLIGWSLQIFSCAAEYAIKRGIIIADTKFEWGRNEYGGIMLADEVFTPDSSRFWDKKEWEEAQKEGRAPTGYDKEPVRQWGKTIETPFGVVGINNLDPTNDKHIAFVHSLEVPDEVISGTAQRYREIARRLIGREVA